MKLCCSGKLPELSDAISQGLHRRDSTEQYMCCVHGSYSTVPCSERCCHSTDSARVCALLDAWLECNGETYDKVKRSFSATSLVHERFEESCTNSFAPTTVRNNTFKFSHLVKKQWQQLEWRQWKQMHCLNSISSSFWQYEQNENRADVLLIVSILILYV